MVHLFLKSKLVFKRISHTLILPKRSNTSRIVYQSVVLWIELAVYISSLIGVPLIPTFSSGESLLEIKNHFYHEVNNQKAHFAPTHSEYTHHIRSTIPREVYQMEAWMIFLYTAVFVTNSTLEHLGPHSHYQIIAISSASHTRWSTKWSLADISIGPIKLTRESNLWPSEAFMLY